MRGRIGAALLAVLALGASPAHAASLDFWGPRVGLSVDPDQVVLGGQLVIAEVGTNLSIEPDIEVGLGDDQTVIAMNLDGKYHARIEDSAWRPYLGIGLTLDYSSVDLPGDDASSTELGGVVILGAAAPTSTGSRFFAETKLGLGDIPLLKLLVGWNFKLR